jgi:glycerate kinase
MPDAHTVCIPMADGGEGTVDALLTATGGRLHRCAVQGALGESLNAYWGELPDGAVIIEMAAAAGLEQIPAARRQPLAASSYGVGQLILSALQSGARRIILGLGGSSTTDGGAGMMRALGVRFLDASGQELANGGGPLALLHRIDCTAMDARIGETEFVVASDVDNPLCGASGAASVFGPQKGASPDDVRVLDAALKHYADIADLDRGTRAQTRAGAGAAGGLGYAAQTFLNAQFRPGVDVVAELGQLAAAIEGASLVITGEGRIDAQTLHGKTPAGVARIAQAAGVPVIALAGSLGEGYEALHAGGITASFSLASGPMTLAHACEQAAALLSDRARDLMRVWQAAQAAMPANPT